MRYIISIVLGFMLGCIMRSANIDVFNWQFWAIWAVVAAFCIHVSLMR